MFQSTHPRRVWLGWSKTTLVLECFNPHTHEGCDLPFLSRTSKADGFNPHTHEGCDKHVKCAYVGRCVSIHTPTKGVTDILDSVGDKLRVSIHTPTKGVTILSIAFKRSSGVSIHTPTKGVTPLFAHTLQPNAVSIHTPTKGVTHQSLVVVIEPLVSIHTPTKGVTRDCRFLAHIHKFQSTHPRRVWPAPSLLFRSILSVSIHTPTKGVTL